jgi:hypothetical protein
MDEEEFESLGIDFHRCDDRRANPGASRALEPRYFIGLGVNISNSVRCIHIQSRSTTTYQFTSTNTRQRPRGAGRYGDGFSTTHVNREKLKELLASVATPLSEPMKENRSGRSQRNSRAF